MPYCGNCGMKFEEGTKFCPACGTPIPGGSKQPIPSYTPPIVPGAPEQMDIRDAQDNRVMAILAYIGILVLIPLLAAKESPFARYHANQGLVLAITEVIYSTVYSILTSIILAISWRLYFLVIIIGLGGFVFLALAILGIINAVNGNMKPLPILGSIRILK